MPAQPQETQRLRASSRPGERPLITVSTSEIRRSQAAAPTPRGKPPEHEIALALKYLRAIEAAGGEAVAHRRQEPGRDFVGAAREFDQTSARLPSAV